MDPKKGKPSSVDQLASISSETFTFIELNRVCADGVFSDKALPEVKTRVARLLYALAMRPKGDKFLEFLVNQLWQLFPEIHPVGKPQAHRRFLRDFKGGKPGKTALSMLSRIDWMGETAPHGVKPKVGAHAQEGRLAGKASAADLINPIRRIDDWLRSCVLTANSGVIRDSQPRTPEAPRTAASSPPPPPDERDLLYEHESFRVYRVLKETRQSVSYGLSLPQSFPYTYYDKQQSIFRNVVAQIDNLPRYLERKCFPVAAQLSKDLALTAIALSRAVDARHEDGIRRYAAEFEQRCQVLSRYCVDAVEDPIPLASEKSYRLLLYDVHDRTMRCYDALKYPKEARAHRKEFIFQSHIEDPLPTLLLKLHADGFHFTYAADVRELQAAIRDLQQAALTADQVLPEGNTYQMSDVMRDEFGAFNQAYENLRPLANVEEAKQQEELYKGINESTQHSAAWHEEQRRLRKEKKRGVVRKPEPITVTEAAKSLVDQMNWRRNAVTLRRARSYISRAIKDGMIDSTGRYRERRIDVISLESWILRQSRKANAKDDRQS